MSVYRSCIFIKSVSRLTGCAYKPNRLAVRIVVSSWWLFCIIVVATYVSNLVAFLAVTQHTLPFKSLEELLTSTDYKFGIQGATAYVIMFRVSWNHALIRCLSSQNNNTTAV